ncbi:MAG: hypothetical protein HOU81_02835 [Hamadaea sp.]|nr:hypothetical protein [Hamadaea sp.]
MTDKVGEQTRVVSAEAIQRFAARSTSDSAEIEGHTLPTEYVRSARVERFLTERRPHTS